MGTMKAALVNVVKKAKKVLSVMPMGISGSAFPLWTARTVVMTGDTPLANTSLFPFPKWDQLTDKRP